MIPKSPAVGVAACFFDLRADSREIQLLPAGEFRARDGRPENLKSWRIDAEIAARLIALATARQTPFVIDYEHQTFNAEDNGQPAPAAGWYRTLEWREGLGLFATDVEWTERAKAMIASREYKFISPVFRFDKKSGAVLELLMAAVTNNPGIDGMAAIAARAAARFHEDQPKETLAMKELLKLIGLAETATEAEAIAAMKVITDARAAADQEIVTLKAKAPDPAKYVPVETVKSLQDQVAALTIANTDREVNDLVAAALDNGRLLPAMESWARELGKKDVAQLKAYIAAAQPIEALGGTQTGGKKPSGGTDGGLDETQLAVCRQLGVSAEDFKKTAAAA